MRIRADDTRAYVENLNTPYWIFEINRFKPRNAFELYECPRFFVLLHQLYKPMSYLVF